MKVPIQDENAKLKMLLSAVTIIILGRVIDDRPLIASYVMLIGVLYELTQHDYDQGVIIMHKQKIRPYFDGVILAFVSSILTQIANYLIAMR